MKGLRVEGLSVKGLGFRVSDLKSGVWGSGSGCKGVVLVSKKGFGFGLVLTEGAGV